MSANQSFRLAGSSEIVEIQCDKAHGEDVIFWNDIMEVFPEVQYLKKGNVHVRKCKDSNGRFHSTNGPTDAPVSHSAGATQIQQITPPPSRGVLSNASVPSSPTPTSSIKTGLKTKLEQENAAESDVDAHLQTSLTDDFEPHDTMDRHDFMQTVHNWLTNQQIKKFVLDMLQVLKRIPGNTK
ncbi:MAG: hypothetical protein J3Q66DRAFT_369266 [Benniella sp.]|nr:MAG: hypothetical protein J3Q66DRAFT_369266 [Benniella sp.]